MVDVEFREIMKLSAQCAALAAALALICSIPCRAQNLYIASQFSSTVAEYDAITGAKISGSLLPGLFKPQNLALSGNSLYVTNIVNSNYWTVGEYDATTGAAINAGMAAGLNPPEGLAVALGNLYVSSSNRIGEYNATTGAAINPLFIGLRFPKDLAVSGNSLYVLYVTGTGTVGGLNVPSYVSEYDATTGALINATLVTGLVAPKGIAVSGGILYVGNTFSKTVGEYNAATGAPIHASLIRSLNPPQSLAISGDGLYVLFMSGTYDGSYVSRYNATTGALISGSLVAGLAQPAAIAVSPPLIGSYAGLATVHGTPSGLFTASMSSEGGFTASLTAAGARYSLKGDFSTTGTFSGTLSNGHTRLDAALTVDPSLPGITGAITAATAGGTNSYTVQGNLLGKETSFPLPGRYTAIIPSPTGTDPTLPHATGFAEMTVSTTGAVRIAGKLGDGTPFTMGGRLQADGTTCALFTPLYGKTNPGSIAGSITFEETSDSDGTFEWIKPAQPADTDYPGGFSLGVDLSAAKYTPPPLAPGAATFTLGGGDLPDSAISDTLTVSSGDRLSVSGINQGEVTLKLIPATGAFSGTFHYPVTGARASFSGVIYEKSSPAGFGLFLGADQIGGVQITQ